MAGSKVSLMVALCSLLILTNLICSTDSASCCLRYTRRPYRCHRLKSYNIQTIYGSCDIPAIIFHTRWGFVCANPADSWVQRGMKCLNEARRKNAARSKK